jgi:hypothetical protein
LAARDQTDAETADENVMHGQNRKIRFSDGSTGSPKGENREKEIEKGRIAGISLNFEENVPSISELECFLLTMLFNSSGTTF